MATDTPRTDKARWNVLSADMNALLLQPACMVVDAEVSEELERELASMQQQLVEARKALLWIDGHGTTPLWVRELIAAARAEGEEET